MPWIDVEEPYAKPPKTNEVPSDDVWSPPLAIDRGWAELTDVTVTADSGLDPADCDELTVRHSSLTGISLTPEHGGLAVEALHSELHGCDLSQVSIRSLRSCRIADCKLIGTDFSGGTVADVTFERCILRYANLRMAKLTRVRFLDCTLDDVDCYQLVAEDVEVPGTGLSAVNFDGLSATRLDLRSATELSLRAVTDLSGCLVAEEQLPALAYALAMAVGIDVERPVQ